MKAPISTTAEATWRERVKDWRASGKTAEQFSENRGFAPSTLRYWSSRLNRVGAPRFVQLLPRPAAESVPEIVIEVGGAQIRVRRGFDAALLSDVVGALGAAR